MNIKSRRLPLDVIAKIGGYDKINRKNTYSAVDSNYCPVLTE